MHDAALSRAALPDPTVILGLALRPYSIGHELFLIRERCWYQAALRPQDLMKAALICCQTWDETRRMTTDWLLGPKLSVWHWRIRKLLREPYLTRELAAFAAYREDGSLEFPLSGITRPNSGPVKTPPGAPFLLRLQQFLMIKLGLAEAEAWDYPLGLAKMRWMSYWEEEGGIEIYNSFDADHDKFVAEMEAKASADAKSAPPAPPKDMDVQPQADPPAPTAPGAPISTPMTGQEGNHA